MPIPEPRTHLPVPPRRPPGDENAGADHLISVKVNLNTESLEALTGKIERLAAVLGEANTLLRELSSNEITVTLETVETQNQTPEDTDA